MNGTHEMGFYVQGIIDGLGRLAFVQGNFYDGELKQGKLQGEGNCLIC